MKALAISIIVLVFSVNLFGQEIQVKVIVDDFTGDTIRYTKKWHKIGGVSLGKYFKAH